MSDTERTSSRLLASLVAALAAGAAIATSARAAPVASPDGAGDDAEILRLAGEFWRLNAIIDAWNGGRVAW